MSLIDAGLLICTTGYPSWVFNLTAGPSFRYGNSQSMCAMKIYFHDINHVLCSGMYLSIIRTLRPHRRTDIQIFEYWHVP